MRWWCRRALTLGALLLIGMGPFSPLPVWAASGRATSTTTAVRPYLRQPFSGPWTITQRFGCTGVVGEPPLGTCAHFHRGLDYGLPLATPVLAAGDGIVTRAGKDPEGAAYNGGYGWSVVIAHASNITTLYGHLLGKPSVHAGEVVRRGQVIGLSGSSGNSTGPHLHFGVGRDGAWIDPEAALSGHFDGPGANDGSPDASATGSATPTSATGSGGCGFTDPLSCIRAGITGTLSDFVTSLGNNIGDWIEKALEPLAVLNIWTDTPSLLTYAAPSVISVWGAAVLISDLLLGLWLTTTCMARAKDAAVGRPVEPLGHMLWQVFTTALMAHLSLAWIGWVIEIANTVANGIGAFRVNDVFMFLVDIVLGGVTGVTLQALLGPAGPIGWILVISMPILKLIILLLVGLQMLRRVALLDLCIITAPLGIMAGIWDKSQEWSRLWHATFWPALISQAVQVMLLHVGFEMTDDIGHVVVVAIDEATQSHASVARVLASIPAPLRDLLAAKVSTDSALIAAVALYLMQSILGLTILYTTLKVPHLLGHTLGRVVGVGHVTAGSALRGVVQGALTVAGGVWHNPVMGPSAMSAVQRGFGLAASEKAEAAGQMVFGEPRYTKKSAPTPVYVGDFVSGGTHHHTHIHPPGGRRKPRHGGDRPPSPPPQPDLEPAG